MMGEQMSERDELARVLAEALASGMAPTQARVVRVWGRDGGDASAGVEANVWAGTPRDVADELAAVALAWFAEHRGPRVVSTVEELDAHDAQVKAEAWDEGYQQGSRDGAEREQQMQMRDWWGEQTTTPNPYRATETEAGR